MKLFSSFFLILFCLMSHDLCSESLEQKTDPSSQIGISLTVFPFQGKVHGKNVNVRSGANVNYEIVARVQEDQDVIVLSQAFDWYQILPPEGTSFWVHQDYVKDNMVTSDAVNVRSGPSLGGSISCQLNRGDIVEIISHEGEWVRIQPPIEARAWIHKDYVVYEKPYEQDLKALELQKKENLVGLRKTQLLKEAKEFEGSEFFKPVDQINFDEIANKYQVIAKEFPEDQALQTEIKAKLDELEIKKINSGAASITQTEVNVPSVVTESSVPISLASKIDDRAISQSSDSNSMIFTGEIEPERGFGKNKRYKLIQNRRRVCFLVQNRFPLKTYLHRNVKVYGKRVSWVYPRIPVLEVEKIEPLS